MSVHTSSGMVAILRAENDVDISGYEALPLSLLFIRLDHVDYVTHTNTCTIFVSRIKARD